MAKGTTIPRDDSNVLVRFSRNSNLAERIDAWAQDKSSGLDRAKAIEALVEIGLEYDKEKSELEDQVRRLFARIGSLQRRLEQMSN